MENPFTPKTQRGLRAFGQLIREWAVNPPNGQLDPRTILVSREAFQAAMKQKGAIDTSENGNGPDYRLRKGIVEIELILRAPDRFTVVLPEEQALADYQGPWPRTVEIPAMYGGAVDPNAVAKMGDDAPATYPVQLEDKTYEKFLDPFMAGYSCSQCL